MEALEETALEPRAERIARYKAERRRELAQRFNSLDNLPSKWVRSGRKEAHEPPSQTHEEITNSDRAGDGASHRSQEVSNGVETDDAASLSNHVSRQGCPDTACLQSKEGPDAPVLHTRVSVGRLRSALLQQGESGAQPERALDAGQSTLSLDLAVKPAADGGRRRARRYLPVGASGGRKTNERFRTQPITANEMEESSGLLDADTEDQQKDEEKIDARAKMSVAAKMSLFKEMERSVTPETSLVLKPRLSNSSQERRVRRNADHRFLTQPITCEEMVAVSASQPAEAHPDPEENGDESCSMSVSEKLALFNKLALPGKLGSAAPDGAPERRRQKGARYRTQPITVEEVSMLQKAPVQLPALRLSAHLSDRQQDSSVNLKPSEVRLTQPRPAQSEEPLRGPTEPGLKGILKKSRSAGSERIGTEGAPQHQQNGGGSMDEEVLHRLEGQEVSAVPLRERQEVSAAPLRERQKRETSTVELVTAAPWRQRARVRRETIDGSPIKFIPEQDAPPERTPRRTPITKKSSLLVENKSDGSESARPDVSWRPEEEKSGSKVDGEKTKKGIAQVLLKEDNLSKSEEEATTSQRKDEPPAPLAERWEPVFASVYSFNSPQYIMCFNQTNLSFEAQEVTPPPHVQPQWRQKAKDADEKLPIAEAEETKAQEEEKEPDEEVCVKTSPRAAEPDSNDQGTSMCGAPIPSASLTEACREEETPPDGWSTDPAPCGDQSLPTAGQPAPCGGIAAPDEGQDLAVLCNAPILSSAVAEHRRSVRPSRRTQGSRNPLRALAARQDIRQDFMGDRLNAAGEEQAQAEQKSKNHSTAEPYTPEDIVPPSDPEMTNSLPPFSKLMLIHIKGQRCVQVRLVEPSARSLNSGDCFLLVTPRHCILWSGEFANQQERAKACELASSIQSHRDLGCQASQVVRLEERHDADSAEAKEFWDLLGGRTNCRGVCSAEEDELFELGVVESNCVYSLVEDRLVPHEEAWASAPNPSLLSSTQALVFDFGSEVYLWHGRDVSLRRRNVALQLTHQVWAGEYDYSNCRVNPLDPTQCSPHIQRKGMGRPAWALLATVSEGEETALFREKFVDRPCTRGDGQQEASDKEETQSPPPPLKSAQPESQSPDLLNPCDAKALWSGESVEDSGPAQVVLEGVDVQRGDGIITLEEGRQIQLKTVAVDTWHVQEFDDSEIKVESSGQLHEGDSYVIRWTYSTSAADPSSKESDCSQRTEEKTAFFLWRGRHSPVSGRDTAAFLSIGLKNPQKSQVVVPQGREPPCFLQLFQGGLVIHKGKREETSTPEAWRLFCVQGELPEEGSLLEVDRCCASLRSRGAVVLLSSQAVVTYLWIGCKAHSNTREVSKRAVEHLTQMCPLELGLHKSSPPEVQLVEEGSEPADFWSALGPMDRKSYDCMLQDPGKYNFTPRLFHLSASSGRFQAKELLSPSRLPGLVMAMPFHQEMLYSVPQPALFLLDNRLEVYLWQRGQPEHLETSAPAGSLWHHERKCAMQTALQYCKEMNPRRPPHAYLLLDGSEPLTFTNVFPRWDRSLGPQTQCDSGRAKLTLVQDALAELVQTQQPSEELQRSSLPAGVDPQQLEVYLSHQDFQTIMDMKKEENTFHPRSKQMDVKTSRELLC